VCVCVKICQIIYEHTGMHIQKQYLRSALKDYDYSVLQHTLLMLWTLYSTSCLAEKSPERFDFGLWTFCQGQWATPKRRATSDTCVIKDLLHRISGVNIPCPCKNTP